MNEDDYAGSVLIVGQTYVSPDYAYCDGTLRAIVDFTTLYAIIGDVYGGDGRSSLGLPDLRGRVPIGPGQGPDLTKRFLGFLGGSPLSHFNPQSDNMPPHSHSAQFNAKQLNSEVLTTADVNGSSIIGALSCGDGVGGVANPQGNFPGTSPGAGVNPWSNTATSTMWPDAIISGSLSGGTITTTFLNSDVPVATGTTGESQDDLVPTALPAQGIQYVISTDGLFPPRS